MNARVIGINHGTLFMQPSRCLLPADTYRPLKALARCIMKRRGKILLLTSAVIVGLLTMLGGHLHQTKFVGQMQFNAGFYATAGTTTQAVSFSYDDYAATLKAYVDDAGMVSYQKMKNDRTKLDDFLVAAAHLELKMYQSWDDKAKIAFWINAYNAMTLKAIIDHYPIKAGLLRGLAYPANSIRQISGVWDKIQFTVMGHKLTLNEIEHGILRGQNKDLLEKYGRFYEPRIHMALVCAAMSCPQLRSEPFIGDKLEEQLDDQTRGFLSDPNKFRVDRNGGKVYLSSIFKWFGEDFVKGHKPGAGFTSGGGDAERAVLHFASAYVSTQDAEYLSMGKYKVKYIDYDWSLNELET